MTADNTNKINCYQCKHFVVTWEPKFPRACKFFGFKTANLPSSSVHTASGIECLGFVRKDSKKEK